MAAYLWFEGRDDRKRDVLKGQVTEIKTDGWKGQLKKREMH